MANTGIARLEEVEVDASLEALRVNRGSRVSITGSHLFPEPTDLASSEPDTWLPLIGVGAVLVAW